MLSHYAGGEPIGESPYLVSVQAAAPAPRKCTAAGAGCASATCGQAAHFVVAVRDQYGNRCVPHQPWLRTLFLTAKI